MNRSGKTRKELVLDRLQQAQGDGWVVGHELCGPEVGGSEGLKRLRELRGDDGYPIEKMKKPGSAEYLYRLAPIPKATLF